MTFWEKWKYKNLTFLLISILFALALSKYEPFHELLIRLGDYGYIGAFVAGILFVSTFTAAIGAVILLILAEELSPLEIALIAGMGAVFGDFMIFRFIKNSLTMEINQLYDHIDGRHHFKKVLHSRYFSWTLPVIGSIIIASPLPDEIGVSLMGISKMSMAKFLVISFILNAIGIFLIISASIIIHP